MIPRCRTYSRATPADPAGHSFAGFALDTEAAVVQDIGMRTGA
ncbi:MAG TPA: hypothetical protein VFY52_04605 [Thermoleophilaceae bacterium]|nr:hypothetical protein [Thermoleophilaceae bacterium]